MKKKISNITLPILAVTMGAIVFVGIYEAAFIFPKYFANPPETFKLLKENIEVTAPYFWIPLQIISFVLLTFNLILNWKIKPIRYLLLSAFICYQMVTVLSITIFVPQINDFLAMSPEIPTTPELISDTTSWLNYSWIRQILLLISFVLILSTLQWYNTFVKYIKPMKVNE